METTITGHRLSSIGTNVSGACSCSLNKTCIDPSHSCNCDSNKNEWRDDSAQLTDVKDVGVTKLFVLQHKNALPGVEGRISLGPVRCLDSSEFVVMK